MKRSEAGSALLVVLVALLLLLPLSLILARMVGMWQRQSAEFRDLMAMEYAAEAGFADATTRLAARQIDLSPDESRSFAVYDLGGLSASVRVSRQPDVVLALDGSVLEGIEAKKVDLSSVGLDPDLRRVRRFRRLEVYLVEVRVSARPSLADVRLRGVLVRPQGGQLLQGGVNLDRGFF